MLIPTSLEKAPVKPSIDNTLLSVCIGQELRRYFATLKQTGQAEPIDLYQTIIEIVEAPLLKAVMELYQYNKSRAASVLGLSLPTLQTKLRYYFQDHYVKTEAAHQRMVKRNARAVKAVFAKCVS